MMNNWLVVFKLCILSMLSISFSVQSKNWFPLSVDVWEPPFNVTRDRNTVSYVPLDKAAEPWKICVSIPHLKDAYWLVVNFALIEEAKRLGVRLRIMEAGGYDYLDVQREQVKRCMNSGADGLILSANDATGLNDLIEDYKKSNKPVVDLINGIKSPHITARAAVTYYDNAQLSAKNLKKLSAGKNKTVLWLPGPKGPAWTSEANDGFHAELKGSNITILDSLWGDTDKEVQKKLIEKFLKKHKYVDYIVGTTVSSDAAVNILKKMQLDKKVSVLSYYYDPSVHKNILRGYVTSGAADQQAIQAKIALDMAVRALEGSLSIKHVGPKILIVDKTSIKQFDASTSIPPKGFRPVFSLKDWVDKQ
jgi:protein TorT